MGISRLFKWKPLWCALSVVCSTPAWAALDLYVEEPLYVYSKPHPSAKRILRLRSGQRVPISPKIYKGWRKVLVRYRDGKVIGYVPIPGIVRSYIRKRGFERAQIKSFRESGGLGGALVTSYMRQGPRTIETSSEDNFDVSELTSTSVFLSVFYDAAIDPFFTLRTFMGLRSTQFKGTSTLTSSGASTQTQVEQGFLSVGFTTKFYRKENPQLWWGLGMELARGQSVSITLKQSMTAQDKPFFFLLSGEFGWDHKLSDRVYLLPSFRAGVVMNTKPVIPAAEILLSVGYSL